MATIQDIEHAIEKLTPEELGKLRDWFARFDAAQWDQQLEANVHAGRLDNLGDEALAEFHEDGTASIS